MLHGMPRPKRTGLPRSWLAGLGVPAAVGLGDRAPTLHQGPHLPRDPHLLQSEQLGNHPVLLRQVFLRVRRVHSLRGTRVWDYGRSVFRGAALAPVSFQMRVQGL